MRAAVIDRFGDPGELHLASVGDPPLGRGQVRVRVIAAGTGATDAITRAGGLTDAALNLAGPAVARSAGCSRSGRRTRRHLASADDYRK